MLSMREEYVYGSCCTKTSLWICFFLLKEFINQTGWKRECWPIHDEPVPPSPYPSHQGKEYPWTRPRLLSWVQVSCLRFHRCVNKNMLQSSVFLKAWIIHQVWTKKNMVMTLFGHISFIISMIFTIFYFSVFCLVLVLIEKIYQILKTVLNQISKYLKVRQKCSATHRIFNSILSVWKCG